LKNYKFIGLLLMATLTTLPLFGQKKWAAPTVVTNYCSGCHGVDGNSQTPYFPKLGGLDANYAGKKMGAFKEPNGPPVDELFWWTLQVAGSRKGPGNVTSDERNNMEGVAHAATPAVLKEAVEWYAKQAPARGHGKGASTLMEEGRTLLTKGMPEQKILACAACHGPNAEGKGAAPRLAGQNAPYMEGQLVKFRKGDRSHSPEMTMVTRDLDPAQAHAAAVYLQSLDR
jgi:cytochrome c553